MKNFIDKEIISYHIHDGHKAMPIRFLKKVLNSLPKNVTHLDLSLCESYDVMFANANFIERREQTQEELELEEREHQKQVEQNYLRAKAIVDNFEKSN